jgi:predicted nucleotidyltransferase
MTDKEMAERTTILRVPAGSTIHGLNLPGKDDRDEMGVCIEDLSYAMGFSEFEQYIYRTATERSGKHDEPSAPGDLDLTIYSLRKFLRLAMQGNPQIVQCLFVPANLWVSGNAVGAQLQELAPYIVSRAAGSRFLGFMESQRQRLLGERGQKKVNRPELEEKFGYDTKYAMHILRLGYQGVQLLSTGRLTLPLPEETRKFVYSVRLGEVPLQEVLTKAGELERELKDLLDSAPIQAKPNVDVVEEWMLRRYLEWWKSNDVRTPREFLSDERGKIGKDS